MDTTAAETRLFPSHAVFNFRYFPSGLNENENDTHFFHYLNVYNVVKFIVTGFVPRLWVMTLWKIFAVDTQFKLKLRINREDLS